MKSKDVSEMPVTGEPAHLEVISATPVGKEYHYWWSFGDGGHSLVIDHDRKRKYRDGKRVPWASKDWEVQ